METRNSEDGLAKIGNAYFMVRSPVGGATHAINPKTKKTYCGRDMVKLWDKWRPIDVLPDSKHEPTCQICKRHYHDPIREELKDLVKDLKDTVDEYLDTRLILEDVEGIGRFTTNLAAFIRSEKKRIKEKKEEKFVKDFKERKAHL